MIALSEQFHHKDKTTVPRRGLQVTGYGLQRGGESVEFYNLQRSLITDQKLGTPDDLLIDQCSLIFERSGGLAGNIPNETTDYLWQGWQVMEERDPFGGTGSTDTPVRQYIWGTYVDECIQLTTYTILGSQSLPAGAYYLLQDLLYRAVALTNSSGAIVEAYDTDAYGNTLIFTGPGADGVWFTNDDVRSNRY